MKLGALKATRETVLNYLVWAYDVSRAEAEEALKKEQNAKDLRDAITLEMLAYHPGDVIGAREGWATADFREDEEDD